MQYELVDICDENNRQLGITKSIREAQEEKLWHRTVNVWIYNSKGELLIQLRAKGKRTSPDKWDLSVAGHVDAGEDPMDTAVRETSEEIGLKISKSQLEFIKLNKDPYHFQYAYLLRFDVRLEDLTLQEDEVQEAKLVPIDKFEAELRSKPEMFVKRGDYWFYMLDKIRERLKG